MCVRLYAPPLGGALASDAFIIRTVKEFAMLHKQDPKAMPVKRAGIYPEFP
ncbi:hypothetical protein ME793_19470 [Lactobacillus delbrueckii]|nr:hypothetical protein ME793_19350 [Lactobacillus delbrueckii]GHN38717.1 hypothetical protein ME793_19470 [Lactobacillus delbrueckii]GHN46391.1 hypothetical protein ME798_19210 [Lactobacillus delbrueckii]